MIDISAQVSLYPLGQDDLSPAIDETLNIFRHHDLDVTPGSMSTLISGDDAAVFSALQHAFQHAVKRGQVVMITTFSNACPVPESNAEQDETRQGEEV
jgi:uncharacterized protein YqgV (UPF0045/DUF77 family)